MKIKNETVRKTQQRETSTDLNSINKGVHDQVESSN